MINIVTYRKKIKDTKSDVEIDALIEEIYDKGMEDERYDNRGCEEPEAPDSIPWEDLD